MRTRMSKTQPFGHGAGPAFTIFAAAALITAATVLAEDEPMVFGNIENTVLIYTAEAVDNKLGNVGGSTPLIRTEGGWRNKLFWVPRASYASGTSTTVYNERNTYSPTNGVTVQGDTYRRVARVDGTEAYSLRAEVISERNLNYDEVDVTWSVRDDPSGECVLSNNVIKAGTKKCTVRLAATDADMKTREVSVGFGGIGTSTAVVQDPYSEAAGSFRKAYTDAILQKFAGLNYGTGHIFPYSMRPSPFADWGPREFSCGRINIPWELELCDGYESFIRTGSYFAGWFNGSTNGTYHTQGRSDPSPSCTYKECLISAAKGATHLNPDFVWPELQDAMRCFAFGRGDWYMEASCAKLSKHYLLVANHAQKSPCRFFRQDGSPVNVNSTFLYHITGTDVAIRYVSAGIPDDIPVMNFLGRHGDEKYSSLYNLSPSLLDGAPALRKTMFNTLAVFYPTIRDSAGFMSEEGRIGCSFKTTKSKADAWVNTTYPAMNKAAAWTTNNLVVPVISEALITAKGGANKIKISDITEWEPYINPNSNNLFPEGANPPAIPGDSSHPCFMYYNGKLWGLFLFHTTGGGPSMLNLEMQAQIDEIIAGDSQTRFGAAEHITTIDCCDIDSNHTYHSH